MTINVVAYASPFFLLLIIGELFYSIKSKKKRYEINDTINNFTTGVLEEVSTFPIKGLLFYFYILVYDHFSLFDLSPKVTSSWILLWLGVDFCYYWFHRAIHRCSLLWIGHSVHHQSQYYNFSVALRQGVFQPFTAWAFYLPLALLGFEPWMFILMVGFNTIYQFWIHTESIRSLGWLELFLNTPSHHRVHHGQNPQYIDKNYGGSLIIWDKCFGTFEPEVQPVQYGVTEPLDSWNPFYANVKVIKDLLYYGQYLKRTRQRILSFFMPPEWIIKQIQEEGTSITKFSRGAPLSITYTLYKIINIVFAVGLYFYIVSHEHELTLQSGLSVGAVLILTLFHLGHISNGARPVVFLELLRSVILMQTLILLGTSIIMAGMIAAVFGVFSVKLTFSSRSIEQQLSY